jgi:hypothetical protein
MRNGSQTVLSLPADAEYDVLIVAPNGGAVTMFDLLVSAEKLKAEPGRMYVGAVKQGVYGFKVRAGESPDMPDESGYDTGQAYFRETKFSYSPDMVMSSELNATKGIYLSISGALELLVMVLFGMTAFIMVCIAISIIHRYNMRNGHPPYSDWYVIVPYLVCIAGMAVLTQYTAFYLHSISSLRAMCAAATVLFIALLALRGAIRSRMPQRLLTGGFLIILAGLTGTYYNKLPIDSFSILHIVIFFVIIALLSALAVRMFRRENSEA